VLDIKRGLNVGVYIIMLVFLCAVTYCGNGAMRVDVGEGRGWAVVEEGVVERSYELLVFGLETLFEPGTHTAQLLVPLIPLSIILVTLDIPIQLIALFLLFFIIPITEIEFIADLDVLVGEGLFVAVSIVVVLLLYLAFRELGWLLAGKLLGSRLSWVLAEWLVVMNDWLRLIVLIIRIWIAFEWPLLEFHCLIHFEALWLYQLLFVFLLVLDLNQLA
jgi:hypothetical protein